MRPYFHARCADTTEIYGGGGGGGGGGGEGGGGGLGGEEEKNSSFENKNVRNFLH